MIGNHKSMQTIRNWLKDFNDKKTTKGGCFLTGSTVLGKTTLIMNLLNEFDYNIIRLVPSTMPSKKDIKVFIHNTLLSRDVVSCFTKKKIKKVLVVDDIENIGPTQKLCLVEFLQWIYPSKKKHKKISAIETGIPFIFVGRHTHIKAVQTALKHCIEVQLEPPTENEQQDYIEQRLIEAKMQCEKPALSILIKHCQNDIRQLRMMVDEITSTKKSVVSEEDIKKILNGYVQIHKENGLLQGTKEILEGKIEFKDSVVLFDTDRYKIPLMIHENYIYVSNKKKMNLNILKIVIDILVAFDQIDSYMYKQQYWNLQYLCGSLICGGVSAIIKNSDTQIIDIDPIFTRHMNRVSLATVKRKNILSLQQEINYQTCSELFYIKCLLLAQKHGKDVNITTDYNIKDTNYGVLENLFS